MKKLKIKGITGTPVFLTRWRGYLDAKRQIVTTEGERWDSNYIQKVLCSCNSFTSGIYRDLETQTFEQHKQSAELVIEYLGLTAYLKAPEPQAGGMTKSVQKRSAARIATVKPNLRKRLSEVQTALADIEEGIGRAVNETGLTKRAAASLTGRKLQAYLHGAALVLHLPSDTNFTVTPEFDAEADYRLRHADNDGARKAILTKIAKEAERNEVVS
ncbi:hypothetical protein SDC9_83969 [bioreactor metagenome]|uniref:Uncharacterized protein n=1 Tax=bioreactor metagenome TaxID=1076179 RepID=A0A644Z9K8_9ZZZZ